jgi:hypothetical protein
VTVTYNCECSGGNYACKDGNTTKVACPVKVITAPSTAACTYNKDTTCSLSGPSAGLGAVLAYSCTCPESGIWSCTSGTP